MESTPRKYEKDMYPYSAHFGFPFETNPLEMGVSCFEGAVFGCFSGETKRKTITLGGPRTPPKKNMGVCMFGFALKPIHPKPISGTHRETLLWAAGRGARGGCHCRGAEFWVAVDGSVFFEGIPFSTKF